MTDDRDRSVPQTAPVPGWGGFALGVLLALAVLVLRLPDVITAPPLWPDDMIYVIHVFQTGEAVWHHINMANVKSYVSLLPMLETWAAVTWFPAAAIPWVLVWTSLLWCAVAQALPLHPISAAVLTGPAERWLAAGLMILLPVSSIGEVVAVAIQHVSFLAIAAWLVAMCVGPNRWVDELRPWGLALLVAALGVAIWSAPTAFVLAPVALIALAWRWWRGLLRGESTVVLAATVLLSVAFLVWGAKPSTSFLYQAVLGPLSDGAVATAIGGAVELARLTAVYWLDGVVWAATVGSAAKLTLGRDWGMGLGASVAAGAVVTGLLILGLWARGRLTRENWPGLVALLGVSVVLIAINFAARWEPENALAIEGFRYWRWRYFTPSQWLVAALAAVVLAGLVRRIGWRWVGPALALWLVALNLSGNLKYREFFKAALHDGTVSRYADLPRGEVARRASGTHAAMALIAETQARLGPDETAALVLPPYDQGLVLRGD